jgi:hypothetical protein
MSFDPLEQYNKLKPLLEKRAELYNKLERSLKLRSFCVDAFDYGSCSTYVIGSPSGGYRFVLKRGNGVETSWPIDQVPSDLLPDNFRRGR